VTDLLGRLATALAERYTVERELGHGGMAVVFLAHDLRHDRRVAIKVLRPELTAALGAERFLREITIAAQLHHPHILPLYDSGDAGGLLYYVMPYVEGESLRDRLARETQLPLEDALGITREVADALSYAHRHDVVHRDIKPENILLEAGHAVVSDFGIARAITAAGGEQLTATGIAVGTPAYMSPEQASGEHRVDGRSDIYSLGCVLYEMLAGAPPFTGPTPQAIMARHSMDPLPSLRTVRAAVPAPVERAIAKALGKVPADRFATPAQFADALTLSSVRVWSATPSRRAWWVAGSLTVLAVGVVLWLALRPRGGAVVPAASVIAVLPPVPASPDTMLARLGRNLVVTLSATLNGVGDLRTIDALTMAAQTQGRGEYTIDQAAALGRRLGASGVVSGTLTRDGANVRLDLGLYAAADAAPVARAFVTASADNLSALTDSATWSLLRQVWRAGAPPSPSLVAVTTRSIPALRAFLEGERDIVENRWPEAERAFARAVEEDSAFWIAHWRLAYARGWQFEELDSAALAPARAHATQLPEAERLLMEAWDAHEMWGERGREVVERFPDYWPGWFERADGLFHVGPLYGQPIEEARHAFERALELNPRLLPAWDHLGVVAHKQRDPALFERAIRATAALGGYTGPDSTTLTLMDRVLLDVLHRAPFAGARVDSLVTRAVAERNPFLQQWAGITFHHDPAVQIEYGRRVLRGGPLPLTAEWIRRGLAASWAARGAWDSALATADGYAPQARGRAPEVDPYRLAVVGAWLGAFAPETALARRLILMQQGGPPQDPDGWYKAFCSWLDGMLAFARRDSAELHAARGRLDTVLAAQAFARSLDAFAIGLRGERRVAAESLEALAYRPSDWRGATFAGINRLAAARWLEADGELDRAARLLLWPQAAFIPDPRWALEAVTLSGLTYLEAGRIEAERGHAEQAGKFYGEFLLRFDRPMSPLQPLVDEARAALARLGSH